MENLKMGENVKIFKAVSLGNNVTIEDDVTIKNGVIVHDGVTITKGTIVPTCAVIPPNTIYSGQELKDWEDYCSYEDILDVYYNKKRFNWNTLSVENL